MAVSSIERKKQAMQAMLDTLIVDTVDDVTFALVLCSKGTHSYRVTIDESYKLRKMPYAVDCDCEGHIKYGKYCTHMQVVDMFYAGVVHIFTNVKADSETNAHTVPVTSEVKAAETLQTPLVIAKQPTLTTTLVKGSLYRGGFSLPDSQSLSGTHKT